MSQEPLPFALALWIKKDQEERRKHQEKMAYKNAEDDKIFMGLIKVLIKQDLNYQETVFLVSLLRHKKMGRNWSPAQRSSIANMYYKKTEDKQAS